MFAAATFASACFGFVVPMIAVCTPGWLKVGDVVTLGIQGLGEQRQKILAFPGK